MTGRTDWAAALARYGWSTDWAERFAAEAGELSADPDLDPQPGRIIRHDGVAVRVALAGGIEHLPVRGTIEAPVVGDWVVVEGGVVTGIVPRVTLLRRRDPDRDLEQPLAANIDMVAVVCGLDRPLSDGRIQRSVMLAWDAGATPLIVLTKTDLVDDAAAKVAYVEAANPGIEVVPVDSLNGAGVIELARVLAGRTVVLVGESGAGKSTLTNALAGQELTVTGEVRESDAKGRHTTTWRELHLLPNDTVVIDSPGIRSVGVWADPEAFAATFADVENLAQGCRFRDCVHESEPGCAVTAAIAAGTLAQPRLDAWRSLVAEAEAAGERLEGQHERQHGRRSARRRVGRPDQEPDQYDESKFEEGEGIDHPDLSP